MVKGGGLLIRFPKGSASSNLVPLVHGFGESSFESVVSGLRSRGRVVIGFEKN